MSNVLRSLRGGKKSSRPPPKKRDRSKSTYSIISLSEVTEGALQIWRTLPEKIRQDPSLASFRAENERLHGPEHDTDPLPNEDHSVTDDQNSNDEHSVTVQVTNELGEQVANLGNGKKTASDHEDHDIHGGIHGHKKQPKWFVIAKITTLLIAWILFTFFLMSNSEKELHYRQLSIAPNNMIVNIDGKPPKPRLGLVIQGAFLGEHDHNHSSGYLKVFVELWFNDSSAVEAISDPLLLPIPIAEGRDAFPELKRKHTFDLNDIEVEKIRQPNALLRFRYENEGDEHFPVQQAYDLTPLNKDLGIILAACVLMGLYVMIIWEIVHRTFAAIIASTMAIGILAALDQRPPMEDIMSWIDTETLLLLFGMMILVAILSETGIFDYLAVYAYKITNGRVWPLINTLCLFTAITSSFLDNVTTVLLMTPVTIRLCEVMNLNPVPILMSMVIYSNIGGALTPVGDPPNVIIASNSYISKNGVNFTVFTMHMAIGIILVSIQAYIHLRYFKFKNINDLRFNEPQDVQELRHEIAVWQRAAASLSSYSKDEDLVRETLEKKCNRLSRQLKKKLVSGSVPIESYKSTLEELQAKYTIRNKVLLYKSGVTLVFVISFFFLHSVPELQRLSLGWTALLGAVLLLILADREDMEAVLARVEWSTLLFFAALFVLMEALGELGLIDWIGKQTEMIILSVSEEARLAVAILLILWVSALASAFVDNIPLTAMMVKIAIGLAENETLGLPLQPLVWALAFGACLGGNGTLIGASANVVCAGVAEQHGYRFTFLEFFKVGFPVMIGSIVVSTAYLMVSHCLFTWHEEV